MLPIHDVEFGEELPVFEPDTRIENTTAFAHSVGWGMRFEDHEGTRRGLRRFGTRNYGVGFLTMHPPLGT